MPPVPPYGFFKAIPASVYSPSFYSSVPQRSFWKGFWHLVFITFALFFIGAVVAWTYFLSHKDDIDSFIQKLNFYPEDLVITIQNGEASTNWMVPYKLRLEDIPVFQNIESEVFRQGFKQGWEDEISYEYLVIVDTSQNYSPEVFIEKNSFVWLAKDTLALHGDVSNNIKVISLSEVKEVVINKTLVDEFLENIWTAILPFLITVSVFMLIIFSTFTVAFRLLYLLFFGLLVWLMSAILKANLDYGQSYKIGLYAITLPIIAQTSLLTASLWLDFQRIPFLFTLLGLIVVALNLSMIPKKTVVS